MIMSDQALYVVRNTPGVTGFVGSHGAGSKTSPLLPEEVDTLLGRLGVPAHAPVDLHAKVGDYVIITEGAFDGMSGKVTEIDPPRLLRSGNEEDRRPPRRVPHQQGAHCHRRRRVRLRLRTGNDGGYYRGNRGRHQ